MRIILALASIVAALTLPASAVGAQVKGSSTISLVGTPAYGSFVTFDVATTATNNPFVNLNCYQNGALVSDGWAAFFPGGTDQTFGLYSPVWKGGPADCQADLGMLDRHGRWVVLASTGFIASG